MKVRVLTQNPLSVGFGGLQIQAQKYIQYTSKNDSSIDIDFFSWKEESFDILHIVGIHASINPYWIDVLKKKGVKIIVSPVFYLAPGSFFDYRRPIIYKLFSYFPYHIVQWMKQVLQLADIILPNSYSEKQQLQNVFSLGDERFYILYNGVEKSFYDNLDSNDVDDIKKKYGVDNYIISVGHIEPRKRHDKMIGGFVEFQKYYTDYKLLLVGDFRGNYHDYHDTIHSLISKNTDIITHIGGLNHDSIDLKALYKGAKAHILLSTLETPGLSNLEAGLGNIPIIVGKCDPVEEYFGDKAYYVDKNDSAPSIAQTIKNSINGNQIHFSSRICENYDWEKIGFQLSNIYIQLGKK